MSHSDPAFRLDDRLGPFSIGLKVVAYDHHLIAKARYVFQVPLQPQTPPSFPASVCRRGGTGRAICSFAFGMFLFQHEDSLLLLFEQVRHVLFVGNLNPGRQDKRSDGFHGGHGDILHKMTRSLARWK